MKKYIFDKKLFGKRIKDARIKKQLTQEQLAVLMNINTNTIAKVENPNNKLTMSYVNLIELVNILDIDINCLFKNEEFQNSSNSNMDKNLINLIDSLTDKEKNIILTLAKSLIQNR